MSTPAWFDSLPLSLTEAEYQALPESVCRSIEVVYGHVIKCESATPRHNRIARRLANALELARQPDGPCLRVETDVDVVLWRVPNFTSRRPDAVVYRCLEDDADKPDAADCALVVEVTSPTTRQEDFVDKRVQYALAGIPGYLVVVLEGATIAAVREFHLDAATGEYRLHRVHTGSLNIDNPVPVTIEFAALTSG